MGWLDNVIAAVSPQTAYRREAWRQAYELLRDNYDAGGYGGINQNWRATNSSAEMTDRYARDNIRARARDLERNSDIMNSVTGAFKRNVVGGGFHVQARTGDLELNKQIEKSWIKWCKKRNCDVTATQSLNQMIRMAVERKKIDGGVLFVKCYTRDGYIPFKLQLIEVDELDTGTVKPKYAGDRVVGGIEYTAYNRAVGYWIRQYDISGYSMSDAVFVKADNVIFYFSKKRPSQLREISDMAQTLTRIRDLNEFMIAVSVKQRIEACLSVFIKKAIPTTGLGRDGGIRDGEGKVTYEGKLLSPGMIKEMNTGDEIQVVNPSGQGADATEFAKLQQRMIGAGQGISYEATSRDMSEATYSSARQGMIEDEMTYKEDKELLTEVLDEIYETFLISAVLCGALQIPDFWENKDTFLAHEWIQEPKAWIDPQKESNANKTALQTGQKTFKQISAENGRDWREQVNDMAEVLTYGRTIGIDLGGVLFGEYKETEDIQTDEGSEGKE